MSYLVRKNSSDSLSLNESRRGSIIKVKMTKDVKNKNDKKKKKNKTGFVDDSVQQVNDSSDNENTPIEQTLAETRKSMTLDSKTKKKKLRSNDGEDGIAIQNKGFQSNEEDDSATVRKSFKPKQPRAAWSADVDTSEPENKVEETQRAQRSENSNQSSAYNSSDESDWKEMLTALNGYMEETEQNLDDWKQRRKSSKKTTEEISRELQQRRNDIEDMLQRCFDEMMDDLTNRSTYELDQLDACIKLGESNLRGMRKIYEKYSPLSDTNQNCEKLKSMMAKVRSRCNKVTNPERQDYHLEPGRSIEEQMEVIKSLLGFGCDASQHKETKPNGGQATEGKGSTEEIPRNLTLPQGFQDTPQVVISVMCRWKKDKRSCGITDVALSDDGRVFAVDNNNKSVKMFDSIQSGGQLLRVLGREVLQKPSRISYLKSQDRIVVTDDGTKSLRVFSASDGSDLGTLCVPLELEYHLQHPVGHCELSDGRFAVIDFKTKSIILWNLLERTGSMKIMTEMHCPAYISVTSGGRLVVSDWKSGQMKIFDIQSTADNSGQAVSVDKKQKITSSRENDKPLAEPHGVCCDENGLIFVADRREHNVRVFSELSSSGDSSLATFNDSDHKVGVPFAVACNSRGMLAVADYVGTIRVYNYISSDD